MSFKQLALDLVSDGIAITGDLVEDIVYTSVVTLGTYDPITDTFIGGTSVVVGPPLTAPLVQFTLEEVDEDDSIVVVTDLKALISAKDLGITIFPKEKDTLVAKGKTWNVQKVKGVPGDSLWVLHIREK